MVRPTVDTKQRAEQGADTRTPPDDPPRGVVGTDADDRVAPSCVNIRREEIRAEFRQHSIDKNCQIASPVDIGLVLVEPTREVQTAHGVPPGAKVGGPEEEIIDVIEDIRFILDFRDCVSHVVIAENVRQARTDGALLEWISLNDEMPKGLRVVEECAPVRLHSPDVGNELSRGYFEADCLGSRKDAAYAGKVRQQVIAAFDIIEGDLPEELDNCDFVRLGLRVILEVDE